MLHYDYHSVEDKLNELNSNGIIDDSYKIINSIQEVMNFATENKVIIYSENSEDESNDSHRTTTSPKIIRPEITTQVINMSTTQEPQESDINVTKVQLRNLENKLFGKTLAFTSYSMNEILSLKDQIKPCKFNDNVQELSTEKSEDFMLLGDRERQREKERE